jgi:uncharacterized peroxidase-related enzyme
MNYVPISKLALVEEQTATGEIAEIFDQIRREMNAPDIPSVFRLMARSQATLTAGWSMFHSFLQRASLPISLLFMMHYSISMARECQYCSINFKENCRAVGIDEETLESLANNLDEVNPRRVREIISFAIQCALNPQSLTEADYDRVREQGVSEEELVEIIGWAAVVVFNDTISDSMKLGDPKAQQFVEE